MKVDISPLPESSVYLSDGTWGPHLWLVARETTSKIPDS